MGLQGGAPTGNLRLDSIIIDQFPTIYVSEEQNLAAMVRPGQIVEIGAPTGI